jgi:hypothetical protein
MKSMKLMLQAEDKTYLTAKLASLSKSKSTIEQLSAWIASRKEYRRQLVRIWFDGLKAGKQICISKYSNESFFSCCIIIIIQLISSIGCKLNLNGIGKPLKVSLS